MANAAGISLLAAFAAGLISFLSPCVAPLMPGYLSLISGATFDGERIAGGAGRRVLVASLAFVAGFTLVFVVMGASASAFGGFIAQYRRLLTVIAGAIMILMGLFISGLLRLPWLYRERRIHHEVGRALTTSETMLLGMAFGFGWTPCIGPLLASILVYTSATETVGRGTVLLLAYSFGLGVPFIALGVGVGRALTAIRWITAHYRVISAVSGAILVVLGLMFLTDRFFYVTIATQRFNAQFVAPITSRYGL
ncbi:MAG TPA: cytochrome c biogenesis protein CcdA [Thermomicrobiaceae bacterium]|nr:cytochrome c biogenesis protein CcdA [Thermomicrobiaceae bacterium]